MSAPDVDPAGVWERELDRLQSDMLLGERVLDGSATEQPAPWSVPSLGPIPEALLPRARQLLERQQALRASLTKALASNSRQRDFSARVTDATTNPGGPVYLDLNA